MALGREGDDSALVNEGSGGSLGEGTSTSFMDGSRVWIGMGFVRPHAVGVLEAAEPEVGEGLEEEEAA